jgi:hypothetical protein
MSPRHTTRTKVLLHGNNGESLVSGGQLPADCIHVSHFFMLSAEDRSLISVQPRNIDRDSPFPLPARRFLPTSAESKPHKHCE